MTLLNGKRVTTQVTIIILVAFATIFNLTIYGAGEIDTNFNANLTSAGIANGTKVLALPDGKSLLSGRFTVLNRTSVNGVVRLNANGTLDPTFKSPEFYRSGATVSIADIALQSDGKILVSGIFYYVNGVLRPSLARLNSDGSLDTTFPTLFTAQDHDIRKIYVYPDDRILVGGWFHNGQANVVRLNANGSTDESFNYGGDQVYAMEVQTDGKVVIGEGSVGNGRFIRRYLDNGTLDSGFATMTLDQIAFAVKQLADGKLLVGGIFNSVNGVTRSKVFRANADGTLDTAFPDLMLNSSVYDFKIGDNGKVYIGGGFNLMAGSDKNKIILVNADGTVDKSFDFTPVLVGKIVQSFGFMPDGKIVAAIGSPISYNIPVVRTNSDGSQDPTFSSPIGGEKGVGFSVKVQPDNKILVGGKYGLANGQTRFGISRFNADGTLDTGFNTGDSNSNLNQYYAVELQPDNKILASGAFDDARRFNQNGSLDVTFAGTKDSFAIEYLQDGKILFGGPNLRRFNSNGTLDATLASVADTVGTLFPTIYEIAVQPDGKIIIVGKFVRVNGVARNRIARLNPDGTIDSSFTPSSGANSDIFSVAIQADGKILIGGSFTSFNSDTNRKYLTRLNSNGSIDTSFSINLNSPTLNIGVQTNGKILIGGSMSSVNGQSRPGIARINSDGSLDSSFNTGTGTNGTVWSFDKQSNGNIIYVGEFTRTNGVSTVGIGRLLDATVPTKTLFDYDGDGRADVSVFRSSENRWYELLSSNSSVTIQNFGSSGDIVAPGDYDGDGKTDIAIFRPSNGTWWYQSSINNAQVATQWGQAGDIPRPSDFDGDGKTDLVVFRPSENNWYRYGSTQGESIVNFGLAGDKPVVGDFDGDGKSDVAIFRPSTGDWWYQSSINNAQLAIHWGISTDRPVPADYDGDGKTDFAVYRPSTGVWYIYNSSNGSITIIQFGIEEDKPVAADYDGDGKADIAVFRPSTGIWYLLNSTTGFSALQFGVSTDIPTPNAFVP